MLMPSTPSSVAIEAVPVACTQLGPGAQEGAEMLKVGLEVYPLPFPPKGMERPVKGPGFTDPLRVAIPLGAPPTGVAPPKVALGGLPDAYAPPAVTLTVFI